MVDDRTLASRQSTKCHGTTLTTSTSLFLFFPLALQKEQRMRNAWLPYFCNNKIVQRVERDGQRNEKC